MNDRADEIARQLEEHARSQYSYSSGTLPLEEYPLWQAAAALRSYAAEIAAPLREALKPFADYCCAAIISHEDSSDDRVWMAFNNTILTYGDLRKAARALSSPTPEGGGG